MQWASAVAQNDELEAAVAAAAEEVLNQLDGRQPDLLVAFVSPHHRARAEEVPAVLAGHCAAGQLIGCTAGGVIGGGREVEQHPAFSLTAAVLPGVALHPFHLDDETLSEVSDCTSWQWKLGVAPTQEPHFLLLPDPFSCDADALLQGLDKCFPDSRKIGGLASGGELLGDHTLYLGDQVHRSGAVGLALSGNIRVAALVAQGCRPIGEPIFVTGVKGNVLRELDSKPALLILNNVFERLDRKDRELLKHSLFLGVAMRDARQEYRQGDYLVRNIIGLDKDTGAIAIGATVPENSVVQFHLRDAETSAEDLNALLSRFAATPAAGRVKGSLLFSCLGRGHHLYGQPNHDTGLFQRHLGGVPLGGFFCNGEIGPVQGATFLHGYTSSFALFSAREE